MFRNAHSKRQSSDHPRVIIACQVLEQELEAMRLEDENVKVRYVDRSLHQTPQRMPPIVQEQIDCAAKYASQIILGFGLCSNAAVGVIAPEQGLIVPRVHDCITLFLGSRQEYEKVFYERPRNFFLTAGWVAQRMDPLGFMEETYVPRVGRETAEWAMKEELKNYTHITLIANDTVDLTPAREQAKANARFFKMTYDKIPGNMGYFRKILSGPYVTEDFLLLAPGEKISQDMFL